MAVGDELGSILNESTDRRRWRWIALAVAIAAAAAIGTYLLVRGGGSGAVLPRQQTTASIGTLAQISTTTGVAEAAKSTDLSFDAGGVVSNVMVRPGDKVTAGQVLAVLDQADAQRDVDQAQANLNLARLRLSSLTTPQAADVASAEQSTASAQSQLASAERALATLKSPSQHDLDAAAQAVSSAESQPRTRTRRSRTCTSGSATACKSVPNRAWVASGNTARAAPSRAASPRAPRTRVRFTAGSGLTGSWQSAIRMAAA